MQGACIPIELLLLHPTLVGWVLTLHDGGVMLEMAYCRCGEVKPTGHHAPRCNALSICC